MSEERDIDFVLPWVDGADPEWIASFNQYKNELGGSLATDARKERYRDYGLLRYWFRGVEKFAPWVRKVHFVTCGQRPGWLNADHPKLSLVRHSDYMPQSALPTFNSTAIEAGMHRIPGLAERFVYFNDDFFLTGNANPDFFFKRGLPCDCASLRVHAASDSCIAIVIVDTMFNNLTCLERNFSKRTIILKHLFKWLSPKYSFRDLIKTAYLFPLKHFTGFLEPHMPNPFTKSCLEEVWRLNGEILEKTVHSRFRSADGVNQWLFRWWQLCKGEFSPANPYKGKAFFGMAAPIEKICSAIKDPKIKVVVINDAGDAAFDAAIGQIRAAFEEILPEKSSFEAD